MKGSSHDRALPHQHRRTIALGQYLNARAGGDDARSANENHLQRSAGQRGLRGQDGGVDLAAVGIALDDCIQHSQGALRWIENLARQQNRSGAGAEDRLAAAVLLQSLKKKVFFQKPENRGRFAAWQNQPIQPDELFRLAPMRGSMCPLVKPVPLKCSDG